MIGHLGTRVSALLDGQLSAQESERAWSHVHTCHFCRDLVERQGWVKTRLATMSQDPGAAPADLKGSLMGLPMPHASSPGGVSPGGAQAMGMQLGSSVEAYAAMASGQSRRVTLGFATIGGGAVGAAVMGVLALGAAPADAPSEPRPPASRVVTPGSPSNGPVGTPVRELRP